MTLRNHLQLHSSSRRTMWERPSVIAQLCQSWTGYTLRKPYAAAFLVELDEPCGNDPALSPAFVNHGPGNTLRTPNYLSLCGTKPWTLTDLFNGCRIWKMSPRMSAFKNIDNIPYFTMCLGLLLIYSMGVESAICLQGCQLSRRLTIYHILRCEY